MEGEAVPSRFVCGATFRPAATEYVKPL